jgi:hypothetical protein
MGDISLAEAVARSLAAVEAPPDNAVHIEINLHDEEDEEEEQDLCGTIDCDVHAWCDPCGEPTCNCRDWCDQGCCVETILCNNCGTRLDGEDSDIRRIATVRFERIEVITISHNRSWGGYIIDDSWVDEEEELDCEDESFECRECGWTAPTLEQLCKLRPAGSDD